MIISCYRVPDLHIDFRTIVVNPVYIQSVEPGGAVVAVRTPKPRVQGSVLGMFKFDLAFHHFSGLLKRRTKHAWELKSGDSTLWLTT
jgi:hypothetical protein